MSKHTPGPWSIPHFARRDTTCDCGFVFSASQRGMDSICVIDFDDEDEFRKVAEANAILIAAAPTMLEVLQKIHAHGYTNMQDHAMVRDVIAQATGEPA